MVLHQTNPSLDSIYYYNYVYPLHWTQHVLFENPLVTEARFTQALESLCKFNLTEHLLKVKILHSKSCPGVSVIPICGISLSQTAL